MSVHESPCPPIHQSTGKDSKEQEVKEKCWKEVERQAIQELASPPMQVTMFRYDELKEGRL